MANLIKNILFRKCPHTSHCIRREFFCDGRVNCAWPNAEEGGTDEVNCDAEGKGNFNFWTQLGKNLYGVAYHHANKTTFF